MLAGVYIANKKDNSIYYRSSLTYRNKHISLGSYSTECDAHNAYLYALELLDSDITVDEAISSTQYLSYEKIVTLINFRDNRMYIPTPIYLRKNYFSYYLSADCELKFDIDDLFYYSSHKILKRQGHLYVNDYGMQITLLTRYGVKSHAVRDRDYRFVNGDTNDFRYSNIEIINPYFGVTRFVKNGVFRYRVRIHINGNHTVGTYHDLTRAAIAYNKAVDLAHSAGINKKYPENYIDDLSAKSYADIYTSVKIAPSYLKYLKSLSPKT